MGNIVTISPSAPQVQNVVLNINDKKSCAEHYKVRVRLNSIQFNVKNSSTMYITALFHPVKHLCNFLKQSG